jgi:predicted MFS family arabinose efflux permease
MSTLVCALANVGSASAASYGGIMVGRVFNGISASVPLGIGAATV